MPPPKVLAVLEDAEDDPGRRWLKLSLLRPAGAGQRRTDVRRLLADDDALFLGAGVVAGCRRYRSSPGARKGSQSSVWLPANIRRLGVAKG